MKLNTKVVWTQRFELDCALYGFTDKQLTLLERNLSHDPGIGKTIDAGFIFEYEVGKFVVRYTITPDYTTVILLQLRPKTAAKPSIGPAFIAQMKDLFIYLAKQGVRKWLGL